MNSQQWTTEKPTKPGIYWLFHKEYRRVVLGEVYGYPGRMTCRAYDCKGRSVDEIAYFIGPIDIPDQPEPDLTYSDA